MRSTYCPKCDRLTRDREGTCASCGAERPVEGWPVDRLIGRLFADDYTVIERLGSGGFGVVYLAENAEFGAKRAVKVLHSRHVHNDAVLRRFKREAKALYRLQSPYTVRMERWGRTEDGHYYMIMEFAEGDTLADVIESEGRLGERRALAIARQIGVALADAHVLNILHRDLKPENIMIRHHRLEGDRIAVLDFGIAKILSDETDSRKSGLVGTPCYMPPECWNPELGEQDIRADLWSLGVILYETLTGDLPFGHESGSRPMSMAYQVCHLDDDELSRDLTKVGVSPATESIVVKLLQQKPADRYPSPTDLVEDIERHPLWSGSAVNRVRRHRGGQPPDIELADTVAQVDPAALDSDQTLMESGPTQLDHGDDDETFEFHDEPPEWLRLNRRTDRRSRRRSTDEGDEDEPRPLRLVTVLIALIMLGLVAILAKFGSAFFPSPDASDAGGLQSDSTAVLADTSENLPATLEGQDGMTLRLVEGGSFTMGSPGDADDNPAHPVMLSDSFYLDEHEVTVEMWQLCVASGGCETQPASNDSACSTPENEADANAPVRCLSWAAADAYCRHVGRRLPTEAEWERAARGPNNELAPAWSDSGSPPDDGDLSAFGVRNLGWGVAEWVADWYSHDYYAVSPTRSPIGPLFGTDRVVRGAPPPDGEGVTWVRRAHHPPEARLETVGFRCATDSRRRAR